MVLFLWLQVLQNLGKSDRTTDDLLDDHVANILKQQVTSCCQILQRGSNQRKLQYLIICYIKLTVVSW